MRLFPFRWNLMTLSSIDRHPFVSSEVEKRVRSFGSRFSTSLETNGLGGVRDALRHVSVPEAFVGFDD